MLYELGFVKRARYASILSTNMLDAKSSRGKPKPNRPGIVPKERSGATKMGPPLPFKGTATMKASPMMSNEMWTKITGLAKTRGTTMATLAKEKDWATRRAIYQEALGKDRSAKATIPAGGESIGASRQKNAPKLEEDIRRGARTVAKRIAPATQRLYAELGISTKGRTSTSKVSPEMKAFVEGLGKRKRRKQEEQRAVMRRLLT